MKFNIVNTGIRLLVVGAVAMASSSCIGNYLNINTNPYEVDKDAMNRDGYAIRAAMTSLYGTVISPHINTAQFTDVLLGGPMGHYYASTGGWDNATIGEFNAPDDWTNPFLASDRIIPVLSTNLKLIKSLTDDPVSHAIANIVKVTAMHRVTDTYGPIPYTKIGEDGKISVPYDDQQTVYETMIAELTECVNTLTLNKTNGISPEADVIFGGDPVKWCKFANSLKLRLAVRMAYASPENAKKYAEEAVNHEIGVMTSNADIARVPAHIFGEGNSMFVAIKYNQPQGVNTGGDTHIAADIACYMNGYNDPRREKYFIPSLFPENKFVGMRIGVERPPFSEACKFSGVNLVRESDMVWMNAAEVAFLRAEAAAIFKFDVLKGASVEDLYNEGIRLSFEQWGAAGYAEYIKNDTDIPETYTDPFGKDSYSGVLTNVKVKWDDAATDEKKQEQIIIQKWIANFNLGNEAWADYRRTGYPRFMPATDKGNKSGGVVDNVLGPRRMPYPQIEKTNNAANLQDAIQNMLKGADNMATDLWWDCKPNHPSKK